MERKFIASVFDHAAARDNLTKDDFQITYRGKNLTPRTASYGRGPRRLMVLLDVSGSMQTTQGNATKWQVARLAAWDLLAALPSGSKVGLITFSATVQTQVPLSTSRDEVTKWLNSEKARRVELLKGRTALFDALESALEQLHPSVPGDAIYVITDGGENASQIRQSKVQKAFRDSGIRLFTLMLPADRYTPPLEFADRETLANLSTESGGVVEWLDAEHGARMFDEQLKKRLVTHAARLSSQISGFYTLTVDLPENPEKAKRWEVAILESGKRKKDARISYPRDVPPCQMHGSGK